MNLKTCFKPLVLALAGVGFAHATPPAPNQLPTGGQVVAGAASISQSGATMTINQASARAAIDWQTFNVGAAAQVNFLQPSASSVTLNRVLDANPSQIFGRINAPGQVFFTNASGMYFAPGASVNVGALVATTHSIGNADFMAGNYRFTRDGATGSIVSEGSLNATLGGYVALLAPEVRNKGVIVAQMGTVALAAGEAYELQLDGNNALSNLRVEAATIKALVDNGNAVQAPGGLVILSAQAVDQLQGSVVTHSGIIEARGITSTGGVIRLDAGNGQTTVSGVLDASAALGQGGSVQVTGERVLIDDGAHLTASGKTGGGEVLVGGSWQNARSEVRQARATIVAQSAWLDASATDSGNGGTVVAWSDITNLNSVTRAYGRFEAKGGQNGGNGGRIETSGHWLDVAGITANASASNGTGGVWLLDPFNLTVSGTATTAATAVGPPYSFSSGAGATNVLNTDIQTQLNGGTSVILQTTGTDGDGNGNGDIDVNSSIAKTAGADATLTLKAHNNITLAASVAISSTTNKLNVVLNANSDATNTGAIKLNNGSSITSNGGDITMGGGANPATTNAIGNATNTIGVHIDRATVSAGAGAISMRGTGVSTGASGVVVTGSTASVTTTSGDISANGTGAGTGAGRYGVFVDAGGSIKTTGGGNITLIGQGSLAGTAANNEGVKTLDGGVVEIQSGTNRTMTITGTGGTGTSFNIGVNSRGTNSAFRMGASATGQMNITGTGGTCSVTGCWGVLVEESAVYESLGASSISFTGTGGTGADNKGIKLNGTATRVGSSTMTGAISLTADTMELTTTAHTVRSTGALTVKQKTAANTIGIAGGAGTLALTAANFSSNFVDGFSGITIGSTAAGAITVGGAVTLNDATTLVSNGNIAVNAALNGSGQTITLTGGSGATVNGSGNITASNLLLNGSGATYTLNTATTNNVGTLAASTGAGNISLINSALMSIGSVGGVNGITNTGTISIETLAGNLTVAESITTTDTSANAVKLTAGKNTAAGTSTGGDIVISGSPTVSTGTGGSATFYTGSVSGSTGLASLIGSGTGRFRYNSSTTTTNYTTALTAGKNAIFREQPTVTTTAVDDSKTMLVAYSGGNGVTYSGFANGDSSSVLTGTLTYGGTSQGAFQIGTYTITPSGYGNGLGYALAYANGRLTIVKANDPPPVPPPPPPALPPQVVTPPLAIEPPPASQPTSPVVNASPSSSSARQDVGAGISVSLVRPPSGQQGGIISVSVPKEMATAGAGFTFPLPAQVSEAAANAPVRVTTAKGEALPSWLRYEQASQSFIAAAVPDGAFPIQVVVTVGGKSTTVMISERAEAAK